MTPLTSTAIRQLRIVAMLEGASFVALLAIAMPLKYLAGMPGAVRVVGMAHGVLFVLYVAALVNAQISARWRLPQVLGLFLASVVPLGPFVADRWLRQQQHATSRTQASVEAQ